MFLQYIKYVGAGGIVGAICLIVMLLLDAYIPTRSPIDQSLITALLYTIGMVINYLSHRYFVFQENLNGRLAYYFLTLVTAGILVSLLTGFLYKLLTAEAILYSGVISLLLANLIATPFSFKIINIIFSPKP